MNIKAPGATSQKDKELLKSLSVRVENILQSRASVSQEPIKVPSCLTTLESYFTSEKDVLALIEHLEQMAKKDEKNWRILVSEMQIKFLGGQRQLLDLQQQVSSLEIALP